MRIPEPEDVRVAAERLRGAATRTPVFTSRVLNAQVDAEVFCKAEMFQRTGSFKFRGAWNALSALDAATRARGVLTWSSGNHAAALAAAGQLLTTPVTVVLPKNALAFKRAAVEGYGAEIIPCEPAEREEVGHRLAEERGLTIIPPYDHDDVIAGQGTAALELIEDFGPFDLLLTPIGGGGLLAGSCLAAALGDPAPRVYGAEPEIADDAARSLAAGVIVELLEMPPTVADGLRTRFIGERNFAILRARAAGIVTVSERSILEATRFLWMRMKLLAEPSGALPIAALLEGKIDVRGKRVGVILSGGNADPVDVGARFGAL